MQPTKNFSSKQENRVAQYLGWSVVSGSGSRDFHPGDVIGDDWLGECKTHTSIQATITFYHKHWKKIQEEALQCNRYPALFVDNGSQKLDSTWVLYPCRLVTADSVKLESLDVVKCGANINFNLSDVESAYSRLCLANSADTHVVLSGYFGKQMVGIVPITTFHSMFC